MHSETTVLKRVSHQFVHAARSHDRNCDFGTHAFQNCCGTRSHHANAQQNYAFEARVLQNCCET
eukprot:2581938-Lingulodinium_polyedra.AAC.1